MQRGASQQGQRAWAGVHSCCKIKLGNIHFWFHWLNWSKPVLKLAVLFFSRLISIPSNQLLQCAGFVFIVILLSQFYGCYANTWCRYNALAGPVKNKSVLEKFLVCNPDQNSWETCPQYLCFDSLSFTRIINTWEKNMPDPILAQYRQTSNEKIPCK